MGIHHERHELLSVNLAMNARVENLSAATEGLESLSYGLIRFFGDLLVFTEILLELEEFHGEISLF